MQKDVCVWLFCQDVTSKQRQEDLNGFKNTNNTTGAEMYSGLQPDLASKLTDPDIRSVCYKQPHLDFAHTQSVASASAQHVQNTSRCCRALACVRGGPAHRWRNTSSTTNITASAGQNTLFQLSNMTQGEEFYLRVVTD